MPRRIGEQRLTTRDRLRAKPFRLLERADRANTDASRGPGAYDRWQTLHRLVGNWVYRGDPLADDPYTWLMLIGRERGTHRPPRTWPDLPFDNDENDPPISEHEIEQEIASVRLPFTDGAQALVEAIARTWAPSLEPRVNTELKKWVRHQKPRLTSLEAKHALIRLALEYVRRVRPDHDPQFVQVGREWLTDAKGRKRLVIPDGSWRYEDQPLMVPVKDYLAQEPDELNSGEYVEWFCREIQHIIRDMILPTPARERRAPARTCVDIVCPVCERGRVIRGRCDQCRIGVSGVLGDQQITARPSPLSRTSKKRRGDRREQIDEQAGMPAEERIDDAEHLDDDEVKGDAADRWLKAQDVSADVGLDESLEPADERVTDTSRELRALARRARQTGLTFHGLQGEILTLAEQHPNLTNRDIALRVSSSEGSVKDARRKIRHKLATL